MKKNVILLTDSKIGTTDEVKLGRQLLLAFLYTICNVEDEELPSHIILYTDAVKLTLEDGQIKDHFEELKQKGVDIVVCGACLEYFDITKDMQFGRVSNMMEIVDLLNHANNVIRP